MQSTVFDVWHKVCDRVAFRYDEEPKATVPVLSSLAWNLDWTRPKQGEVMRCNTCKEPIRDTRELETRRESTQEIVCW